jgi:hypothetical protein
MLRHAPIAVAILLFGSIGCGGGSSSKPDAGGLGGSGGGLGGSGLAGAGGPGTGGSVGGGAMPTGTRVLQGTEAALLDLGAPCTNEEGATGDRWCAIIAPSPLMPTNAALFVVNVTKVAAGTPVTCGQTDANCLKLTDTFGENADHPAMFRGDTLVYYDATTATPFGWRAGMTAGKALATLDSDADAFCVPSAKGTAVYCVRLLPTAMQTDPSNVVLVDVLAGHLEDAATPPLARIDTVIAASASDQTVTHFQVGFPVPGSETIAWSARTSASGAEVLKIQTLGNDTSRATVATGINSWQVSPDGARWYWLTNISEATGVGAVQSAPFPAGASPLALASNVTQFENPTPSSLLVIDTAKNLTFIADPGSPSAIGRSLDTGVTSFLAFDGKGTVAYVKTIVSNSDGSVKATDLFVKKTDGTGACALTSMSDAYPFAFDFTASGAAAAWGQRTITSAAMQYTRFSDCVKMTVGANAVFFVQTIGDKGIVYLDGLDSALGVATAKLRGIAADGALSADPALVVSGQVGSLTVPAGTDMLVYSVNGGGNDDGVYVRPFGP